MKSLIFSILLFLPICILAQGTMNNDSIIKAKELYFRYGGSSYQMYRDGVNKEYEAFKISKELEKIWLDELFENEFKRLDINDFNTAFPLWHIIETHCSFDNLQRFIDFVRTKINESNNQYYIHRFSYQIFSLLVNMSKSCNDFPRELKVNCIEVAEMVNDKAKHAVIPKDFKIPDFNAIGEGLTQEQYVYRSINDLEYKFELIRILK
jgi:hypothetical protein